MKPVLQTEHLSAALDLKARAWGQGPGYCPGEGGLPLGPLLGRLAPDLPLSVELRSKSVRDDYPDAVARARAILKSTQDFLAKAA